MGDSDLIPEPLFSFTSHALPSPFLGAECCLSAPLSQLTPAIPCTQQSRGKGDRLLLSPLWMGNRHGCLALPNANPPPTPHPPTPDIWTSCCPVPRTFCLRDVWAGG